MRKIQDNFADGSSAYDKEWTEGAIRKLFKQWRSNAPIPKGLYNEGKIVETVTNTFGLRGLQFGNWLNNEDRYNYALAAYAAFYDMNKVLRFRTNNLGLNKSLALGLGSRGIPRSLAHYEGDRFVINITRYKRADRILALDDSKPWRFLNTGGAGSFAHEYAHFLDNAYGLWSDLSKDSNWLTGEPRSTSKKKIIYNPKKNPIRFQLEEVFEEMLWTDGKPSKFQERILEQTDYYNYKTEMFARLFEVYIAYKLQEKGIYNRFLVKRKYKAPVYVTTSEMKAIVPKMDKLIQLMRERT